MSIEAIQAAGGPELQFGPFRLFPQQRLLLRTGTPLRLGSRARELLFALVERAGEVVKKNELVARVWPNTIVEEGTLRVHINGLRKALGDGKSGIRYVENVTGLGYRFIAPVTRHDITTAATPTDIPVPLTRMVGREALLASLTLRLAQARSTRGGLLTLVGPGGIGKTTVAANLAERLRSSYRDGIRYVDLASNAGLAPQAAVSAAFGLGPGAQDSLAPLLCALRGKQVLIVLDNCERVVGHAAALAEKLLGAGPEIHILATSREPLRTQSESLLHLPALELPVPGQPLTVQQALAFPAIQLFVERAMAARETFELTEANTPIVAEICQELDGVPLTIELAAARADLFGVLEVRSRVHDPLGFLTRGRRTAPARHQSLRAMLDWSYETLSDVERLAFRRLGIFDRRFDLNAAVMEIADETLDAAHVPDIVASLASKSLLAREDVDGRVMYKLRGASRAYALEKLISSTEDCETFTTAPTMGNLRYWPAVI